MLCHFIKFYIVVYQFIRHTSGKQNYWTIKGGLWDFVHSYTCQLWVLGGLEAIPVKFRKIMNEL